MRHSHWGEDTARRRPRTLARPPPRGRATSPCTVHESGTAMLENLHMGCRIGKTRMRGGRDAWIALRRGRGMR